MCFLPLVELVVLQLAPHRGTSISCSPPNAPPNISSAAAFFSSSLDFSADVFGPATSSPHNGHRARLKYALSHGGCCPRGVVVYHEALSMLRPGFKSRRGRLTGAIHPFCRITQSFFLDFEIKKSPHQERTPDEGKNPLGCINLNY